MFKQFGALSIGKQSIIGNSGHLLGASQPSGGRALSLFQFLYSKAMLVDMTAALPGEGACPFDNLLNELENSLRAISVKQFQMSQCLSQNDRKRRREKQRR